MSFLELRNISKSYGVGSTLVHALVDASLSVDRGSLVAVMGPSGSGKSSLLTIAGSLEEPTSGEVLIDGKSLASMSHNDKARLRRRTIGYVFQDFNLLAGLTALENVSLPLELDDLSARKARTLAMTALENVGIAERAGHFPDELSGGERQRVAIARAVVGERHLLLADEPSGALDSANGEAVMKMIRGACKQGVAAVVVTHDAHLASWADRVVFLKDGRIVDQTVPPPSAESLLAPDADLMSVSLAAPRGEARSARGLTPSRRAVVRWAWRLFRREWRQQLLVLALIIVAVTATIVGSAVATNTPLPANYRVRYRPGHGHLRRVRPPSRRRDRLLGAPLRQGRRHRERDAEGPRLGRYLPATSPEPERPLRPTDALPRLGPLPSCSRPGGRHGWSRIGAST